MLTSSISLDSSLNRPLFSPRLHAKCIGNVRIYNIIIGSWLHCIYWWSLYTLDKPYFKTVFVK